MRRLTYPFVAFRDEDGALLTPPGSFLPVRLKNPSSGHELVTYALIDSGADECAFPEVIAATLGHKMKGPSVQIETTLGVSGPGKVFKHTFDVEILHPTSRVVVKSFQRLLVACVTAQIPPLLGIKGCLEHFCVTLDYPRKQTRLSW